MPWEWLDTALDYGGKALDAIDTVGNAWDRFANNPLVNAGAGYYFSDRASDRSNAAIAQGMEDLRTGMNNANRTTRNFRDNTLQTAGQTYNTAKTATAPYRQAGTQALDSYMGILEDPTSLYDDPAYQWALDQGLEGIGRKAAATGFRGSGNEMLDFIKFGQGNAMGYRNDILSGYTPIISAGQWGVGELNNAGQHRDSITAATNYGASNTISENERAMGEYMAGGRIGGAANDTQFDAEFMRLLGLGGGSGGSTGNPNQATGAPGGGVIGAANDVRNVVNGVREVGNLATAGGGNPLAAAGESARQVGTGNWADPMAGPRTTAKMPTGTNTLASAGYTGTVGTATALGTDVGAGMYMGADGLVTDLTGMAAGEAGGGAAATGPFGTGAAGIAAIPAAMWGGLEFLQNMKNFKGGAAEGAKIGKFTTQLQNDMKADPTGAKATQTMKSLINGGLWAGEANQWVIGTLMKDGALGFNSPLLYGQKSIADPFANKGSDSYLGKDVELQSYGIPAAQAKRYTDILTKQNAAAKESSRRTSGADSMLTAGQAPKATPQELEFMKQIEARMTPQARLQTAMRTRQGILAADPRADVTKLNQFIRSNS